MIAPEHTNSSAPQDDSGAPQDELATGDNETGLVADVDAVRRGESAGDTAASPSDTPIRTTSEANESGYPAAPGTDRQRSAEAKPIRGGNGRARQIKVDGGHVAAAVDLALTDAAADVLWRIVEKAMRKDETG